MAVIPKGRRSVKAGQTRKGKTSDPVARKQLAIPELGDQLESFIKQIESRVERLFSSASSPRELAFETLAILRTLIDSEVHNETLEVGIAVFFDRLSGEHVISELAQSLYRQARQIAFSLVDLDSVTQLSVTEVVLSLSQILCWYRKRKLNLRLLESRCELKGQNALLFDLKVAHDRYYAGVVGAEIRCGVFISGRPRQTVWLKVFVRHKRRFVTVRENWESWGGSARAFMLTDLSHNDRVVALVPIECLTQRLIVDSASLFIPYAALGLDEGEFEVVFEAQLCDSSGRELTNEKSGETIYLAAEYDSDPPVPSPHALGFWPHDFVSGSRIDNVRATVNQSFEVSQLDEMILVGCDIVVSGQVGERLQIGYSFLDEHGDLIGGIEESVSDQRGAFYCSRQVEPTQIVQHYYQVEAEIPVAILKIPLEIKQLYCQIVLSTSQGRVLCGTISPCHNFS